MTNNKLLCTYIYNSLYIHIYIYIIYNYRIMRICAYHAQSQADPSKRNADGKRARGRILREALRAQATNVFQWMSSGRANTFTIVRLLLRSQWLLSKRAWLTRTPSETEWFRTFSERPCDSETSWCGQFDNPAAPS